MNDFAQNSNALLRFVDTVEQRVYGNACPECGFDGNYDALEIVIGWEDPQADVPPASEYCETCGHPVRLVLDWGDDEAIEQTLGLQWENIGRNADESMEV